MTNMTARAVRQIGLTWEQVSRREPRHHRDVPADAGPRRPARRVHRASARSSPRSAARTTSRASRDDPPVGVGTNYPDYVVNPMHAVTALIAALRHRRRTGEGQLIDMAQLESSVAAMAGPLFAWDERRHRVPRARATACLSARRTASSAAPRGPRARPLAGDRLPRRRAVGRRSRPPPATPSGAPSRDSPPSRRARRTRTSSTPCSRRGRRSHDGTDAMERLQAAGVPAGLALRASEVLADPHLAARGYFRWLDHAEAGRRAYDGPGFRLSKTPRRRRAAPLLGEHTREIADRVLGLRADEIGTLMAEQVLYRASAARRVVRPAGALPAAAAHSFARSGDGGPGTNDKKLAEEGADWIAEMVSEDLGGFVPAELIDLVMELEMKLRAEHADPEMDHQAMAELLLPLMEAEGVPTQTGRCYTRLLVEILHWEDEFRAMAGHPRTVRLRSRAAARHAWSATPVDRASADSVPQSPHVLEVRAVPPSRASSGMPGTSSKNASPGILRRRGSCGSPRARCARRRCSRDGRARRRAASSNRSRARPRAVRGRSRCRTPSSRLAALGVGDVVPGREGVACVDAHLQAVASCPTQRHPELARTPSRSRRRAPPRSRAPAPPCPAPRSRMRVIASHICRSTASRPRPLCDPVCSTTPSAPIASGDRQRVHDRSRRLLSSSRSSVARFAR